MAKKISIGLLVCVLLATLSQVSIAAERTYDLKVFGCWN
jgi:hypothetical protein